MDASCQRNGTNRLPIKHLRIPHQYPSSHAAAALCTPQRGSCSESSHIFSRYCQQTLHVLPMCQTCLNMKYSECSCALVRDPIQHSPAWHFPRVHHGPENFPLKAILELQPWRDYFRTMLRQPCLRFAQFAVSCNYASWQKPLLGILLPWQ